MKIWEPKPPGTLWATPGMGLLYLYLYLKNYSRKGIKTIYPLIKPVNKQTTPEDKLDASGPESSTKSHFSLRLKAVSGY